LDQAEYNLLMEEWKLVCQSPLFQWLKHGEGRVVMDLLADGKISVGKAAEEIVRQFELRLPPHLPEIAR